MFAREHKFLALIENCDTGCDEAIIALCRQLCNLKRGVESIAGMNLFQEFARQFGEGNELLADVVRKQSCSRRSESEDLQTMHNRS